METATPFTHALHDVGLAAWFGGALMGAVGVNGAAAAVDDRTQRARVATVGWSRWAPVSAGFVGAHLVGAAALTWGNKGRIAGQEGVARLAVAKGVLTAAALGATAYSRVLGNRMHEAGDVPVEGGADPAPDTPPAVAHAQRRLSVLQWAIPALTGAMLVVGAGMEEQQRPSRVMAGLARRLPGL